MNRDTGAPCLHTSSDLAARLTTAPAAIVLLGSYDGSTNFGDVAQYLEALRLVKASGSDVPVLSIVELQYREQLLALGASMPEVLDGDPVFFDSGDDPALEPPADCRVLDALPSRVLLYLYGGGYVNARWGGRKSAMALEVRRLIGRRWWGHEPYARVIATGLQVTGGVGALAEQLHAASFVGVRDHASLGAAAELGERVRFTGDDALAALWSDRAANTPDARALNVHLSVEDYVTEDASSRLRTARDVVTGLAARHTPERVHLLVAFPDERIGEARVAHALAGDLRDQPELSHVDVEVVDVVARMAAGSSPLPDASACVTSSYHVGLGSLVNGVPAVLLHQGDYYAQKMSGLAALFELPPELVLRDGDDPAAALQRIVEVVTVPTARTAFLAGSRAGVARSLAGRTDAERAVLRAILELDGGAAWEQANRLGTQFAASVAEVADLRERVENLLLAGRASARMSSSTTGGR